MAKSKQLFANNVKTTLASAVAPSDTTATLVDASGIPAINSANGEYVRLTFEASGVIEVVSVTGVSGNVITITRGAENGGTGLAFPSGSKAELRSTKGTFETFARKVDVLDTVSFLKDLTSPATSNSNSYIVNESDEAGNQIMVYCNKTSGTIWTINGYDYLLSTSAVSTGWTTTSLTGSFTSVLASTGATPPARRYLLQVTSGAGIGQIRNISAVNSTTISWTDALAITPSVGDTVKIYQSNYFTTQDILTKVNGSLVYSMIFGE